MAESPAGGGRTDETYHPARELDQFQQTKAGVKGLVDCGATKIPRIFIHSPENLPNPPARGCSGWGFQVPIISLRSINEIHRRQEIVEMVYKASTTWGFFQLVDHGIPNIILDSMLEAIRDFHEGDREVKAKLYCLEKTRKVRYFSNSRLSKSGAASWHDTLACDFDGSLDPNDIPIVCRKPIMEYREHILTFANLICELLSESLGLDTGYLKNMISTQKEFMVCHYYPPCPEPELTLGTTKHTDPSFLTILLQDGIGGLQVLRQDQWVDVTPIHRALIVNIGDLLQLVSNDKLKSVEHRVLANRKDLRLSVATFINPRKQEEKHFGPIEELLSETNPPLYRELVVKEYLKHYASQGISTSTLSHFKL